MITQKQIDARDEFISSFVTFRAMGYALNDKSVNMHMQAIADADKEADGTI